MIFKKIKSASGRCTFYSYHLKPWEELHVTVLEMCLIYVYSTVLQKGLKDTQSETALPQTGMKKKSKGRNRVERGLRWKGQN